MRKFRGKRIDNGEWVYGCGFEPYNAGWKSYIAVGHLEHGKTTYTLYEVIPSTVGQQTGLKETQGKEREIYEGDCVVMECWNGGDGIDEPSIRDTFEGIVIYDKRICRFGLQTKLCNEGQIEVGLKDSQFTSVEIIDVIHDEPGEECEG